MKLIIQNNKVAYTATNEYVQNGSEQDIVTVPDGTDITNYVYLGNNVATAQANLTASLENYRMAAQNAGHSYTFPDGVGVIQTRDQTLYQDISNINGQVTAALILQSQNVTTPVLDFRDESNVTHYMTPAQVIDMGMAVSTFISELYLYKWNLATEIAAYTTMEQIEAFNPSSGWPT